MQPFRLRELPRLPLQQVLQRLLLSVAVLLSLVGWLQYTRRGYQAGILFSAHSRLAISLAWGVLLAGLIFWLVLFWLQPRRAQRNLKRLVKMLPNHRLGLLLIYGLSISLYTFVLLGPYGDDLGRLSIRSGLLVPLVLIGTVLVKAAWPDRSWLAAAGLALLGGAAVYRALAPLSEVTAYPFTLGWSETSRYYYASLYFSERIYGLSVPPTVLHPSRYLMQSVPFVFPDSPLWLHRIWQVILWVSVSSLTSFLFSRRLKTTDRQIALMLSAWMFLFLFIGPVYYHLQVPVILLLAWFDHRRPWRSLVVVLAASAWAGISRVNWFPLPASLALVLYLLEKPVPDRQFIRYLTWPLLWSLSGVSAAFGAQTLYAVLSGNPVEQFTSSFSSALLWYRLLPNPTHQIGILAGSLLISLPFIAVIGLHLLANKGAYHILRWLGIGAILLVFFTGGLVVSVKIGGGSNLHNLDAYLVLLAVVSAYALLNRIRPEDEAPAGQNSNQTGLLFGGAVLVLLIIPVYYALGFGSRLDLTDPNTVRDALDKMTRTLQKELEPGDEVLFLAERQLITFDYLPETTLVPDYERVFLMEMVMGSNEAYLARFHADLRQQRYAVIFSEPLFTRLKGREEAFGEENDVWVQQVSEPVLCYYKPSATLRAVRVQILVPRDMPKDCSF